MKIGARFEYDGKGYVGELSSVMGAGSTTVYYLMIDNSFCGRLRYCNNAWVFDETPKKKGWETLASFFGTLVEEHQNKAR